MKRKYRILKNGSRCRYRAEYREWWMMFWLSCYYDSAGIAKEYVCLEHARDEILKHRESKSDWVVIEDA